MGDIDDKRRALRAKYSYVPYDSPPNLIVGVAENIRSGLQPINGVRTLPENSTTGWYIWAGEEMSTDPAFFKPLHVAHLATWCPAVIPFLELPPGWRFLLAPGYEDAWADPEVDLAPIDP